MNLPVKYRPKTFEEVTGQRHVTKTLQNALRKGKIAHAYLFAGPRGVGKTTTARILAKGLNCVHGPTPNPCNSCEVCKEIDDGRSLDVIEIDGASNRGIDEIRNLREQVRFLPTKGRYRVFIIDEVHMLTTEAFNALLKTLEEPPAHVVFVLATTEPRKVPETVVSRTQRFDFRPLSIEEIVRRLAEIARNENIEADEESFRTIARYADGSLRDAIALLEQLAVFSEGKITPHEVKMMLGVIEDEFFLELFRMILERNAQKALIHINELFSQGYSVKDFVSGFQNACESMLRTRLGLENNIFEEIAFEFQPEDILGFLKAGMKMEEALRYSYQPHIWVEYHIVRLIFMPRTIEIQNLLNRAGFTLFGSQDVKTSVESQTSNETENIGVLPTSQIQETFRKAQSQPVKESSEKPAKQKEQKKKFSELERIASIVFEWNPSLSYILKEYGSVEGKSLTISIEDDIVRNLIERDKEKLESTIREILGTDAELRLKNFSKKKNSLLENPKMKKLIEELNLEVIEDVRFTENSKGHV